MAFGIKRNELLQWKSKVANGEIAFITHYWRDDRFPTCNTVTKVGCSNIAKLIQWGKTYHLQANWIDLHPKYPHFDLFGEKQKEVLLKEGIIDQIERFQL